MLSVGAVQVAADKHTWIRMAMYTSISGSGSLVLFLLSCTSSLYWATTLCIASPSMPMYSMKVRAVALLGEYVRMMTEHSTRSVSLLRRDDIERRARRVKRESNWATARSRRTKLPRMSTVVASAPWCRWRPDALPVATMWHGHILRTGQDEVQLVQGQLAEAMACGIHDTYQQWPSARRSRLGAARPRRRRLPCPRPCWSLLQNIRGREGAGRTEKRVKMAWWVMRW